MSEESEIIMKRPFEVDVSEYPFDDHWLSYRDGYIHYVDEGKGATLLLLHGNPTWSYIYRNIIKELRGECRLVALDYPGFGMSKAPSKYGFTPREQAEAVTELIHRLELKNIVLVVQDWGGPIGMNYAVQNRSNLRGLVVMNTWAWPASFLQRIFSVVMGGWPIGYYLQTHRNYFAKAMLPDGIYHKEKVTPILRKAYTDPFPTVDSRKPTYIFPGQIRKAHPWLASIESQLPILGNLPAQIVWGSKNDPGFGPKEMKKWQGFLKMDETEILEDASHSVQEDRPDRVAAAIRRVLERTQAQV
ncbi:MAG TPA: alpha/beta fold hydrolase [Candidatus Limnocylindrales bacterium]|nr:alpha/beta fold hydrolase [Candidatus Limnocylindrales bacterium]